VDEMLEVTIHDREGIPVVRAHGEVDVSTAPALRAELMSIAEDSPKVVVDLSDVTFLDSTGLGVLIAAMKRFRDSSTGGHLHLVVTRPHIQKVLEVTGLTSIFEVHSSLDDALRP
jgi:anti-sigma B factor antagonist